MINKSINHKHKKPETELCKQVKAELGMTKRNIRKVRKEAQSIRKELRDKYVW